MLCFSDLGYFHWGKVMLKTLVSRIPIALVGLLLMGSMALAGDSEVKVHITKTGTKYHKAGCRYLSKSDYTITLKEAKERGYDACKVCKPPQ